MYYDIWQRDPYGKWHKVFSMKHHHEVGHYVESLLPGDVEIKVKKSSKS